MKYFRIVGIIFLLFPLSAIPIQLKKIDVLEKGHIVKAILDEGPENCGSRNLIAKFSFQNDVFTSQISKKKCYSLKKGDTVQFLHYHKYPDIYILKTSKDWYYLQIVACILLSLLGLSVLLIKKEAFDKRYGGGNRKQ